MKPLLLLTLVGLLTACQKDDSYAPSDAADPDWLKLQLPTKYSDEAVHALTGDLSKTLLASTNGVVYSSSDRGKTWQVSRDATIRVMGLLQRNDTVFALGAQQGPYAVSADAFTMDMGKTWQGPGLIKRHSRYSEPILQIGRTGKAGTIFQLIELREPVNANTERIVGYEIIRTGANGQTKVRLPNIRRRFIHLHLDAENYLYVTASAYRFDAAGKVVDDKTKEVNAVVYVSRQPML